MGLLNKLFKKENFCSDSMIKKQNEKRRFALNMEKDFEKYGIINEVEDKMEKPKYDEIKSLKVLLSRVGISKPMIKQILERQRSRESMYNKVLQVCDKFELERYVSERACLYEANRIKDRILIKFIANALSIDECIEFTFLYLLNEVGVILFWNPNRKDITDFNWDTLDSILSQDSYPSILKFFDERMVVCFKYYLCNKGKMTINDVLNHGYEFLNRNSRSGITVHGSLYQYLGEETVINILNRIIQVIIDSKSPSFKQILIEENNNEVLCADLKYNPMKMKKHRKFRNSYVLGVDEIEYFDEDLEQISTITNNNTEISKYVHNIKMSVKDIDFANENTRLDYTEYTPTGTTPEFPYKICAFARHIKTQSRIIAGYGIVVEYDTNQEIGKYRYTNCINGRVIEIKGKSSKGNLVVSSLYIAGKRVY